VSSLKDLVSLPSNGLQHFIVLTKKVGFAEWGYHGYDETRRRTVEEIHYVPGNQVLWRINLWNSFPPTRYEINVTSPSQPNCTKSNLPYPWRPYGIGFNDTFIGAEILGSSAIAGAYVDVQRWAQFWNNGSDHQTVTVRGCVPVRRERVDNTTNPPNIYQEHWYDVVIGIPNPNAFVPPAYCPS